MNTTPYGPKCPRASGKSYIRISDLCYEGSDFRGVLDSLRRLDSARDIDAPGPHPADRLGAVVPRQPARKDQRPVACGGHHRPVEALAHAAVLLDVAVEQPGRGARKRSQVF